jgi:hypothetical protein
VRAGFVELQRPFGSSVGQEFEVRVSPYDTAREDEQSWRVIRRAGLLHDEPHPPGGVVVVAGKFAMPVPWFIVEECRAPSFSAIKVSCALEPLPTSLLSSIATLEGEEEQEVVCSGWPRL